MKQMNLEEVQKLYEFLQGKEMKSYTFREQPRLSPEAAFAVIYFLQEEFGVIPDYYEVCENCGNIYDSYDSNTVGLCDYCE